MCLPAFPVLTLPFAHTPQRMDLDRRREEALAPSGSRWLMERTRAPGGSSGRCRGGGGLTCEEEEEKMFGRGSVTARKWTTVTH